MKRMKRKETMTRRVWWKRTVKPEMRQSGWWVLIALAICHAILSGNAVFASNDHLSVGHFPRLEGGHPIDSHDLVDDANAMREIETANATETSTATV
jgi:hypothetical protein